MDFPELLKIAQSVLHERRLSQNASAGTVAAGESRMVKLAATGVDDGGKGCAPCGRCREFINCIDDENYLCEVMLEDGGVTTIGALLPHRL